MLVPYRETTQPHNPEKLDFNYNPVSSDAQTQVRLFIEMTCNIKSASLCSRALKES